MTHKKHWILVDDMLKVFKNFLFQFHTTCWNVAPPKAVIPEAALSYYKHDEHKQK